MLPEAAKQHDPRELSLLSGSVAEMEMNSDTAALEERKEKSHRHFHWSMGSNLILDVTPHGPPQPISAQFSFWLSQCET